MKRVHEQLAVLYPLDHDMSKQWFVKYPNPSGGNPLKKYGELNKIVNIVDRLLEADRLIASCAEDIDLAKLRSAVMIDELADIVQVRIQGKKPKTRYAYTSKFKVFTEWFRTETDGKINLLSGTKFLAFLKDKRNLGNVSINSYRRNLKSIFQDLEEQGKMEFNPFDASKALHQQVHTKTWFRPETQVSMKLLIANLDPQLWAACLTQFYCFIRPGDELMGLTIGDIINREDTSWKFRISEQTAKTGRFRFVPIAPDLKEVLESYIEGFPDHFFIFGRGGTPNADKIARYTLYNRHRMYLNSLDLPIGHSFYSWKNTGAVMMYKNGIKMKYISLLMGHSSIETTDMYFKSLGIDDIMEEVKIAYPSIG